MGIPNIYENRHYKLYVLIPVALLLVSLYFIPQIQLDSSLRGGITITLQSNSTIDQRQLISLIDSRIGGAEASVARAPGGISITIASNTSIASAEAELLAAYSYYGNYTKASYIATGLSSLLKGDPNNSTLQGEFSAAKANASNAYSKLNSSITAEFGALAQIAPNAAYNSTSVDSLLGSGKNALALANGQYEKKVVSALQSIIPFSTYSYETVTPTLSSYFLSQIFDIIIGSFIVVAVIVLFVFRNFIPSMTVVFGAANDLIIALGAMGAFGIPLGVASIGGLLMLIGYSIDTDILSAMKILKRHEGTAEQRALSTFKTGITMTSTAAIVFSILFIVSYVSFIPTYFEISGVVLAGLAGDILATWFGNVVLVLWYKKRKERA